MFTRKQFVRTRNLIQTTGGVSTSIYKAAVIGLGKKGFTYDLDNGYLSHERPHSHVGAYIECHRTKLVGVCDTSEETLEKWKGIHPDIPAFVEVQDMMNTVKPNIVSIATTTESHYRLARMVPRYNSVKVLMVEKPLATTSKEADDIVRTAAHFGTKLAVNHQRRWDPVWSKAKNTALLMGKTKRVVGYCSGDMLEAGIHMADLFNFFGDPNGIYVDLMGETTYNPYLVFELDVFCEEGRVRILENGRRVESFVKEKSNHWDGLNELRFSLARSKAEVGNMPLMTRIVQSLVDAADGYGARIACTGEDGVAALKIYESWKK